MATIRKTFRVYKIEAHKLFAETTGPYYNEARVEGYFLRETDIYGDTEEFCLKAIEEDNGFGMMQDFVILPVYYKNTT